MIIHIVDDDASLRARVKEALASRLVEAQGGAGASLEMGRQVRYPWELSGVTANQSTIVIFDLYPGPRYWDDRPPDPPIAGQLIPSRPTDTYANLVRAVIDNISSYILPLTAEYGWHAIVFTHVVQALEKAEHESDRAFAALIQNLLHGSQVEYVPKPEVIAHADDVVQLVDAVMKNVLRAQKEGSV